MLCCYQPRRKLTIFAKMVALPNLIYRKNPYTQQQQINKSLMQFAVHEMYKSAPIYSRFFKPATNIGKISILILIAEISFNCNK